MRPSPRRGSCATAVRRPRISVRAAIFLNGAPDSERLIQAVAERADFVVAADGGASYALAAGIVPDLIVGDMDSLGEDLAQEVERSRRRAGTPPGEEGQDGRAPRRAGRRKNGERPPPTFLCAAGGKLGAVFAVPHILLAAERTRACAPASSPTGEGCSWSNPAPGP